MFKNGTTTSSTRRVGNTSTDWGTAQHAAPPVGAGIARAHPGRAAMVRAKMSHLLTLVGLAVFALVVGLLVFVALAPRLIGWHFVIVSGASMEPTIPFGSLAVVDEVAPGDIRPGDIVTFAHPVYRGRVVTHRVVTISEDGQATTKGDANSRPDDGTVGIQQMHYRYRFAIPVLGHVVRWLRSRPGTIAAIVVPGMVAILLEVASIWKQVRIMRSTRRGRPPLGTPAR